MSRIPVVSICVQNLRYVSVVRTTRDINEVLYITRVKFHFGAYFGRLFIDFQVALLEIKRFCLLMIKIDVFLAKVSLIPKGAYSLAALAIVCRCPVRHKRE